jgi:hypothetical protein
MCRQRRALRLYLLSLLGASDTEGNSNDFGSEDNADYDPKWHRDTRTKLADNAHVGAECEDPGVTFGSRTIARLVEVEPSDKSEPTRAIQQARSRRDAVRYADPLRS